MKISDRFTPLARGLAASHFVDAYDQYHRALRQFGAEHKVTRETKVALDEARAFRKEVEPTWEELVITDQSFEGVPA